MSSRETHGGRTCPICGRPTEHAFRPFCSRRCADVDLHRWLSDSYVVPGMRDDADEEDGASSERPPSSGQRRGESL